MNNEYTWEPSGLIPPDEAVRPNPPRICGFLYDRKRHTLSGEPESAKSMLSLIFALEYIRATEPGNAFGLGANVMIVDFEGNRDTVSNMLAELGATAEEVKRFLYYQPDGPPTDQDVAFITVDQDCGLIIIDSAIGAYDASNLDDEKTKQVERMGKLWVKPFWESGAATLLLDHVTKDAGNRGRWMIGSQRKLGQADTSLGVDAITPISRGTTGLYKIVAGKDRGGYLKRGQVVAELHLTSDPDTHRIGWEFKKPTATLDDDGGWKPTILMARVSNLLAEAPDGLSRKTIEQLVRGKSNQHKRQAIDELITLGHAAAAGAGPTSRIVFVSTYTSPTSPALAATSPGDPDGYLAHLAVPLQGGEARGEVNGHIDQDEIERLAWLATVIDEDAEQPT